MEHSEEENRFMERKAKEHINVVPLLLLPKEEQDKLRSTTVEIVLSNGFTKGTLFNYNGNIAWNLPE